MSTAARIQAGTVVANNLPAYTTVAFPVPFSSVPNVQMNYVSQSSAPGLGVYVPTVYNVTTTTFQFYATYIMNGAGALGQVFGSGDTYSWIAISPSG